MVNFELDPGKLVHWLGGEYTGARREVNRTLAAAKDHVSTDDFNHMKRILLDGFPFELKFDKPLGNKQTLLSHDTKHHALVENQLLSPLRLLFSLQTLT